MNERKGTPKLPRVSFYGEIFRAIVGWFARRLAIVEPGNISIDMSAIDKGAGNSTILL